MGTHPNHPNPIERSTFEWNGLIRRSSSNPHQALSIYLHSLLPSRAIPNKFTFTFLLKSCARACVVVPRLHAHLIAFGLQADAFLSSALMSAYADLSQIATVRHLFALSPSKDTALCTALVSAYAKCGLPDSARQAFDQIPHPNAISWAALISAYAKSNRHADALSAFRRMRLADVRPTEAALVSALAASAGLCDVQEGKHAHALIVVSMDRLTPALGTAVLNMYAKCGLIDDSLKMFDEMRERDQTSWTAMISAMAAHGRGEEALKLFDEMLLAGVVPDHVTYVGILHACSHSHGRGMVDEARCHFQNMRRVHGIEARAEHYGCMVDVLGRGGRVEEAWELVRSMPMEPDEYVLKSLLSACCSHGFVEWAEWAAKKLRTIDAGHASSHVMLANTYAVLGRWEDSARVRRLMRERGVPKTPGSSAIC